MTRRRAWPVVCAFAIGALTLIVPPLSQAQIPARETPPAVGTMRPFALPTRRDFSLANGLKVTLVPFGTTPKATLYCIVDTGRAADGDRPGLADLTVAMMKEGAGLRDATAVAALAAEMGGSLDISAGINETSIGMDVLSERVNDALALMADTLRRPRLPASELSRLKNDFARAIAIERSQAQGVAADVFARQLWGDSPYGRGNPSPTQLAQITNDDVREFFQREFGARRAHLYVAGRFDEALLRRAITRYFGSWARGPEPHPVSPQGNIQRSVTLIDRPGAAQSTVLMGLPAVDVRHPDYTALSVANGVLGGSLLSRLEQNLREDKGYTYGISSQLTPYRGVSGWTLATDVNTPDTAPAIMEIFKEINRLRTEPLTDAELDLTKRYRIGHFLLGSSSRSGLLGQLAFIDEQALPIEWLTHYADRTESITPEQTTRAAANAIDPQRMTLVVVGDLARIRTALHALPPLQGVDLRETAMESTP